MKKIIGIILISLITALLHRYFGFIKIHLLDILEFILYSIAGLAILIIAIYIKDRIAYHKLRKEMTRKVATE